MKNINFINPISSSQASSIRAWFTSSLLLAASLIIGLSMMTGKQYLELRALNHEKEQLHTSTISFNSTMQRKQELKKQEQALNEQLNLVATTIKQTQQHALLMANIKKTLKNLATLESLALETNTIQLCIDCTQTQQASEIITSLSQLPNIAGLHMNSLQPKQQGATTALRLNLRGTIKSI